MGKLMVKIGEDEDAVRQEVKDAMTELWQKSDTALLPYSSKTKFQLMQIRISSQLGTVCLVTTTDCAEVVEALIVDNFNTAFQTDGNIGSSLVQAGVSAAVKIAVRILRIPRLSTGTGEERKVVTKAYLALRASE